MMKTKKRGQVKNKLNNYNYKTKLTLLMGSARVPAGSDRTRSCNPFPPASGGGVWGVPPPSPLPGKRASTPSPCS